MFGSEARGARLLVVIAVIGAGMLAACGGAEPTSDPTARSSQTASATAIATATANESPAAAERTPSGAPSEAVTQTATADAEPRSLPAGWVDAHNHGAPGPLLNLAEPRWAAAGIVSTVVFIEADLEDPELTADELAVAERLGDAVIPFLDPSQIPYAGYTARSVRASLEPFLQRGAYAGIGEVVLGTITPYAQPVLPDAAALDGIWDLARDYDLPVLLHVDPVPEYVAALDRLLQRRTDVTFIWAHMGIAGFPSALVDGGEFGDPDAYFVNVERMLEAYPRLMIDLSTWDPQNSFDVAAPDPRWIEFVERYPSRFLWGTDFAASGEYARIDGLSENDEFGLFAALPALLDEYDRDVATYRSWFALLPPEVVELVTRVNALALLGR